MHAPDVAATKGGKVVLSKRVYKPHDWCHCEQNQWQRGWRYHPAKRRRQQLGHDGRQRRELACCLLVGRDKNEMAEYLERNGENDPEAEGGA